MSVTEMLIAFRSAYLGTARGLSFKRQKVVLSICCCCVSVVYLR